MGPAGPATAGREHGVGVAETVGEAEPQPMGGNDLAGAVLADQGHVPAGVGAHLIGVAQYLVGSDGVERPRRSCSTRVVCGPTTSVRPRPNTEVGRCSRTPPR